MKIELSDANSKELLEVRKLMEAIEEGGDVTVNEAAGISFAIAKMELLKILSKKQRKGKSK